MTKKEIVNKIWDADGQLKMSIILNPDPRKIYDAMDEYAKQQAIAFTQWLDKQINKRKEISSGWLSSYSDIQRRGEIRALEMVKEKFLTLTPPPTTLS